MPKSPPVSSDLRLLEAFWREPVARTVLPNGLTLIVKRDASAALASVQVWVKTGSLHEGSHLGAGKSKGRKLSGFWFHCGCPRLAEVMRLLPFAAKAVQPQSHRGTENIHRNEGFLCASVSLWLIRSG